MATICTKCGEKHEEGKLCICEITEKKELLKNRKKTFYLKKNTTGDLLNHLLKSRNISKTYEEFIAINFQELYNEGFLNQKAGVNRIIQALEAGEKIAIYGDYDADGITGTALGYNILKALGGKVIYYINDRFSQGFGINTTGVETLAREKVSLIITVDNGIAGIEGVKRGKELGLDIIVTDHHEANGELPDCLLIDPKQPGETYSNKEITGVGVLFKVLLEVCRHYDKETIAKREMDLVALGTVADMGALLGENRLLVRTGLLIWNHPKGKPGIKTLIEKLGIKKEITAYEMGFVFGPLLNAESRLKGRPDKSIKILTTKDSREIEDGVAELVSMNQQRKTLLEEQLLIGDSLIEPDKDFFFLWDDRITEGIAGLIASRLADTYKKPVIVLGKTHEGKYKGSGRSIPEFNLKKALDKNSPLLFKYGGHQQACGLTIEEDNLILVKSFLETEAKMQLGGRILSEEIILDAELTMEDLNQAFIEKINRLEPFGIGFKKPIFLIKSIEIGKIQLMKGIHSKFSYKGIDFLAFNKILQEGQRVHLTGYPSLNEYKGRTSVQLMISDILQEETEICELET